MLKSLPEVKTANQLLAKDYQLLADLELPLKDKLEHSLLPAFVCHLGGNSGGGAYLAAACQCFYLFFRFHSLDDGKSRKNILLGDYFFSRFLELLVESGHDHLLEHFCRFVSEKCQNPPAAKPLSPGELLPFIAFIAKESRKDRPQAADLPFYRPYEESFALYQAEPLI